MFGIQIDETKSGVNAKLDVWREVLESKGFRISRTKTEYVKCNFSKNRNINDEIVKIASQEIRRSENLDIQDPLSSKKVKQMKM